MMPDHSAELRPAAGTTLAMVLLLLLTALATSLLAATANNRIADSSANLSHTQLPEQVTFNAHIRPILSNTCFVCHGPDRETNPTEFQLDSFASATGTLPSDEDLVGIKPGDPEGSEVYRRIMGTADGEQMPPADFRHQLSDYDRALFRKWIEQGAEYQQHWSYTRINRPAPPPVIEDADKINHPIDAFVLARLEREGIDPTEQADKATLLRRLSLDLIGLPPTPAELDTFLRDNAPNAYRKQVDRLLASPRFGERMASQWLDIVRFSDTVGFHGDQNHRIYPYRDYIINALNDNMPFDEFTRDQLAGDLVPNPTPEQLAATGLVRMNMMTREGGAQPEEYLAKYTADRVRLIGTAWLGSTTACCECHNHKFDPFTAKDFYSLGAFFDDVRQWGVYSDYDYTPNPELKSFHNHHPFPPELRLKNKSTVEHLLHQEKVFDAVVSQRVTEKQRQSQEYEQWQTSVRELLGTHSDGWQPAVVERVESKLNKQSVTHNNRIVQLLGDPEKDVVTITTRVESLLPIAAIRLEALPDESRGGHVGRSQEGRFKVSLTAHVQPATTAGQERKPKAVKPRYVRIELPNRGFLSLAEVQVLAKGEKGEAQNIAVHGAAKQSSTGFDGPARLAIDGNTNGDHRGGKSVSHTIDDLEPWWELDLKDEREFESIVVWNRTDNNLAGRLKNYRVVLLDAERQELWHDRPNLPLPSTAVTPPKTVKDLGVRKLQFATAQADRQDPAAYKLGETPAYLSGTWQSGPSVWQLPKDEAKQKHTAVFHLLSPVDLSNDDRLIFKLKTADIAKVRISVTPLVRAVAGMPAVNPRLQQALQTDGKLEDANAIPAAYYLSTTPAKEYGSQLEGLRDNIAKLHSGYAMTMVVDRVPEAKRRKSRILPRGNWQDKSGPLVEPAVPGFLPQPQNSSQRRLTRLDLANWLTSPQNPLTARHYVNRTWKHFFGAGLSNKLEDLGSQGEWPSHPQLLDWLAAEFIESGWDVKHLIRSIVSSRTYQQQAAVRGDLVSIDPYNRLLAQQAPRRLEAEAVRDNALAIAGLLNTDLVGGPSVFPYQPTGHWRIISPPGRPYPTSGGQQQFRRGVYVHWQRSFLHPMMVNFDAPARDECAADRPLSNSPQQALTLLNDPEFVEASLAMALRVLESSPGGEFTSQLEYAFKLALARSPTTQEQGGLQELFRRQLTYYQDNPKEAKKLLEAGHIEFATDKPSTLAAMSRVCHVILNLHETITRF